MESRHTPGYDELSEYKDTHRLFGAILGACGGRGSRSRHPARMYVDGRTVDSPLHHTTITQTHQQTGFVIGFRVNNAYQLYYEGRRIVGQIINSIREIILESYTSLPKGTDG